MLRSIKRGRPIVGIVGALVLSIALVAPATAASPQRVTIVSHVTFVDGGPNFGDFVASGPAVDSGAICASGTFVDTGIKFSGFQSDRGVVQLQVLKAFTCDGSGDTFSIKLQIQANFDTGIETFSWVAMDGLRGSGRGSTVPEPPTGNINTYQGFVLD
jgi:hypothetical protein